MSALITDLCNTYELRQLVDYEALAATYRAGSEGYPTTSTPRGDDGGWEITVMGDPTWSWKATTKNPGAKA